MEKTKDLLNQLVVGNIQFQDFLNLESELAELMQKSSYSKPVLHEDTPLSILCMNLYQAIKAANRKQSASVNISCFYSNPLCKHWLSKAELALQNGS
ncbi:hypothetical protein H5187_08905 [Pseudoalteromonas sp. SG44-1]|uniref:hypothetical protein n=1 Tax=Pseudoalteromonas sp. SG44-1 TaxID=2760964 RepID=UPI00160269DC|nr:hypothetical protein [Pseudoalteromonas sp. SG44-1]MBB1417394.1 hypothetical protein [Pseudoalteromonas sp. SG44-1]